MDRFATELVKTMLNDLYRMVILKDNNTSTCVLFKQVVFYVVHLCVFLKQIYFYNLNSQTLTLIPFPCITDDVKELNLCLNNCFLNFILNVRQSGRIGADEEIDDFKGRSVDEVEEILAEKEAKTQAILLEMVNMFNLFP